MNVRYKEEFLFFYLNQNIVELQAHGNKISSLGYELIYKAMEAYKRFGLLKRGADPVDGTQMEVDMNDDHIRYILEHPYDKHYPFFKELIQNATINSEDIRRSPEQSTAPKRTKKSDTANSTDPSGEVQPVSPQQ